MQKRRPERCKQTDCYKDGRVGRDRYVACICEHPVEEREHRHVHERRDRKHQRQRGERAPKRRCEQIARSESIGSLCRGGKAGGPSGSAERLAVGTVRFGMQLILSHARILSRGNNESAAHPKVHGAPYIDPRERSSRPGRQQAKRAPVAPRRLKRRSNDAQPANRRDALAPQARGERLKRRRTARLRPNPAGPYAWPVAASMPARRPSTIVRPQARPVNRFG